MSYLMGQSAFIMLTLERILKDLSMYVVVFSFSNRDDGINIPSIVEGMEWACDRLSI